MFGVDWLGSSPQLHDVTEADTGPGFGVVVVLEDGGHCNTSLYWEISLAQSTLTVPLVLLVPASSPPKAAPSLPPPVPHGSLGSSLLSLCPTQQDRRHHCPEQESLRN